MKANRAAIGAACRAMARQAGQSSTEYVVICAALAMALGIGMADDSSVLKRLVVAFFTAFSNYSFAISLPG